MTVYYFLFLFYFVIGCIELGNSPKIRNKMLYSLLLAIPLFLLTAFRSASVGNDTIVYKNAFEDLISYPSFNSLVSNSRFEAGYLFISYYLAKSGWNYFDFQIVVSAFIYISWAIFLARYSSKIAVNFFFFSVISIMFKTMNVVRMELAIAILLFSIPYILRKKFFIFLSFTILAYFFHHSSFIFALLFPISIIKYNKRTTFFIIVFAILITYMGSTFFDLFTDAIGLYQGYTEGMYFDEDRNILGVTLNFSIHILLLIFFYKRNVLMPAQYIDSKSKESVNMHYLCTMAFWINLGFCIIGFTNNTMNRITGYLDFSLLLLLELAINSFHKREQKVFFFILIGGAFFVKQMVQLIYRPEWNRVVPYESFLDNVF